MNPGMHLFVDPKQQREAQEEEIMDTDISRFERQGFAAYPEMSLQSLINSGLAWRLEGSIGRQCMDCIERGDCVLGEVGHTDYYGNYVPSRYEVVPGTKGSLEYFLHALDENEADRRSFCADLCQEEMEADPAYSTQFDSCFNVCMEEK